MSNPDQTDIIVREMLKHNPEFAEALSSFMVLYDSADVLARIRPPGYEYIVKYLQIMAARSLSDRGVPRELVDVMIAVRPPFNSKNLY